jgi:N-acyl-D-aspartate/D-glutamate deacylase
MKKKIIFGIIAAMLFSNVTMADSASNFDLVILNGRVMDPDTGHDAVKNIGVSDGHIISITTDELRGEKVIDARGLVVAPGFIDLHNHSQNAGGYKRSAQDGVTTSLELEVGVFPIADYYETRKNRALINFGASVSHPLVRSLAFGVTDISKLTGNSEIDLMGLHSQPGWEQEKSTQVQRAELKRLVRQGLQEGGLGIGYHLVYTPGSDVSEMLDLYTLSAQEKVTNFIHIRSLGQVSPTQSGREVVHAAATTGASIHVVHVNSSGLWETKELLDILSEAQKNGLDVSTEVYPYDAAPTTMADPRVTGKGGLDMFRIGYDDLELVATGERLTEETFNRYKEQAPETEIIAHIMSQDDVDMAVAHPMVMIASDSGDITDGRGHPRGAATFARILGPYVRDKKILTLMEGLRKVSLMPAQRMETSVPQMKKRGRIQEGMVADITIFSADKIADKASFVQAALPSDGIAYVIVNGTPILEDYKLRENVFPGQAIRRAVSE